MRRRGWCGLLVMLGLAGAIAVLRGCGGGGPAAPDTLPDATRAATAGGVSARTGGPASMTGATVVEHASSVATRRGGGPLASPNEALCRSERRAQLTEVRDRLSPDASPREALAHAVLSTLLRRHAGADGPPTDALFHAARARWPEDLDLAWASTMRCSAGNGCNPHAALQELARVDADNAYTWVQHMRQAADDNDDDAFAVALRRAATAPHFDTRAGSIFVAVRPILGDPPPASCMDAAALAALEPTFGRMPTAGDLADLEAINVEMAEWMPAYAVLARCRPPLARRATRRDCVAMLENVATGDTLVDRGLSLRLLVELQPEGPAGQAARERYRRHLWLRERSLVPPLPVDFVSRQVADGEVAALQAHLDAKGLWPPPDDWLPEDPAHRALVTGQPVPAGQ